MAVTVEVEGSTAVAIVVAASTVADPPTAAIVAACTVVPDATEAWAGSRRRVVPDPPGPGLGKAGALVTPHRDGIRLQDQRTEVQRMEGQETAQASRLLTAQAWLHRTARPSPTVRGTPSETPAVRLHRASSARLTASTAFNHGGLSEFGAAWRGGRFGWGGWGGGWGCWGCGWGFAWSPFWYWPPYWYSPWWDDYPIYPY
jgi:hypothetical protein